MAAITPPAGLGLGLGLDTSCPHPSRFVVHRFEVNHWLLNDFCRLAVDNLLHAAIKRMLGIGIFCAIHTYGRRLNWHPQVHVSVTCACFDEHGN